MKVSLLVPFTPGCPHREAAWEWVRHRYETVFPTWEIVTGEGASSSTSPADSVAVKVDGADAVIPGEFAAYLNLTPDGYSRSQAILDAADKATGEVFVVTDADVWCHPGLAVLRATEDGWAIPHKLIHRLSPESTDKVLAGADWHSLPLSTDNPQDSKPYRGNETGTLVVMRRDVFTKAPPDPRFVGWGQEDDAWQVALRTMVGPPWRGDDDLVHLWHPAQPRKNRVVGSDAGKALARRYQAARNNRPRMAQLLEEVR